MVNHIMSSKEDREALHERIRKLARETVIINGVEAGWSSQAVAEKLGISHSAKLVRAVMQRMNGLTEQVADINGNLRPRWDIRYISRQEGREPPRTDERRQRELARESARSHLRKQQEEERRAKDEAVWRPDHEQRGGVVESKRPARRMPAIERASKAISECTIEVTRVLRAGELQDDGLPYEMTLHGKAEKLMALLQQLQKLPASRRDSPGRERKREDDGEWKSPSHTQDTNTA